MIRLFMVLTLIHPAFFIDKGIPGGGGNLPPPLCISGTAIGRDLKFYRDYNWFKSRSNTKFQVNPMAPAPLRGADIRKTSILFFENLFSRKWLSFRL